MIKGLQLLMFAGIETIHDAGYTQGPGAVPPPEAGSDEERCYRQRAGGHPRKGSFISPMILAQDIMSEGYWLHISW